MMHVRAGLSCKPPGSKAGIHTGVLQSMYAGTRFGSVRPLVLCALDDCNGLVIELDSFVLVAGRKRDTEHKQAWSCIKSAR